VKRLGPSPRNPKFVLFLEKIEEHSSGSDSYQLSSKIKVAIQKYLKVQKCEFCKPGLFAWKVKNCPFPRADMISEPQHNNRITVSPKNVIPWWNLALFHFFGVFA
jgi:hypothetical protein